MCNLYGCRAPAVVPQRIFIEDADQHHSLLASLFIPTIIFAFLTLVSHMPLHPIIGDNPASCRRRASALRLKVFAHFPVNCRVFWHHIIIPQAHHPAGSDLVQTHLHFYINTFVHRIMPTFRDSQVVNDATPGFALVFVCIPEPEINASHILTSVR